MTLLASATILLLQLKTQLVEKAGSVAGGLKETPEEREQILALVKKLEAKNPTKK